ncbi:hypothetical protein CVT26_015312 [Gymnopilus dilepis]|uniref:F-box domain-containing protein n=1 Tax=Gymnopilus dilepis TaxID=231916 RepID=A0A409W483_9AGAR|nr:hypothetical protein CVT26_015312 [Gymnopilus dilepis]
MAIPVSKTDVRLRLTWVCFAWRRLILSTSSFWADYQILNRPFKDPSKVISIFQTIASRSRNHPLSLRFSTDFIRYEIGDHDDQVPFGTVGFDTGSLNPILFINPYVSRLKYLSIFISLKHNSTALVDLLRTAFSILETFDVTVADDVNHRHSSFTISRARPFGPQAPLIAYIQRMAGGLSPLLCSLPWENMTRAHFSSSIITVAYFFGIMHHSQHRLLEASFTILFDAAWSTVRYSMQFPIVMTHLTHFYVRTIKCPPNIDIVRCVRMPNIKAFSVCRVEATFPVQWDITPYTMLFAASHGSLERLRFSLQYPGSEEVVLIHGNLSHPRTTSASLRALLEAVPNLESLRLPIGTNISADVLADLGSQTLLPRLSTLQLASDTDGRLLFDAVRRRSTITSLNLALPSISAAQDSWLRAEADNFCLDASRACKLELLPPCVVCKSCCALIS